MFWAVLRDNTLKDSVWMTMLKAKQMEEKEEDDNYDYEGKYQVHWQIRKKVIPKLIIH